MPRALVSCWKPSKYAACHPLSKKAHLNSKGHFNLGSTEQRAEDYIAVGILYQLLNICLQSPFVCFVLIS